jgi:hypothetical protein
MYVIREVFHASWMAIAASTAPPEVAATAEGEEALRKER